MIKGSIHRHYFKLFKLCEIVQFVKPRELEIIIYYFDFLVIKMSQFVSNIGHRNGYTGSNNSILL